MIDSMFQEGTDTALDDQVQRPNLTTPPPRFSWTGIFSAPFKGVGGGVAKSIAFGSEVSGAFGQVEGATDPASAGGMFSTQTPAERQQASTARDKLIKEGPDFSNEAGDIFRARAKDILPDAQTTHASEQVVAGLTDFATRAVGYSVTLGPLAPAAFGGDTGLEEADRLKQLGVDKGTRTKAGAVAGVLNAAAVAVPMTGATALTRFAKGAVAGEATMVGQSVAEKAILKADGYDKIADTFDPFDPVSLALGLLPGALGAKFGHATPKLGALRSEAEMLAAAKLSPEEAAREAAYESSPANLRALEQAIAKEKRPEVRAELETELRTQQAAAAGEHGVSKAVEAEPDLVPAARVMQTADALDSSRLTPDADMAGRDSHLSAVEMAHEQMARGEPVDVEYIVAPTMEEPVHVSEQNGRLSAVIDGGSVSGEIRDGALHINRSELVPEKRGAGLGVSMYQALLDEAHARGLRVFSDSSVSGDAARVYDALGRRGYQVDRMAAGELMAPGGAVDSVFGRPGAPAFEVRPKARGPEVSASALDQMRAARTPPEPRVKAEPVKEPAEPGKPAPPGAESETPASVARAAAAVDPDMMVHLEGMDAPMRVADLLTKIQDEAKRDTQMGKLVEVAAACDLTA